MIHRRKISLLISLFVFFSFFLVLSIPLKESGTVLAKGWTLEQEGEPPELVSLPYYRKTDRESTILLSCVPPAGDYRTLALIWPDVTSAVIYWNGNPVQSLGDSSAPSGNMWNYFHVISLPEPPDGHDMLTIKVTGLYDIHLKRPLYIDSHRIIYPRAALHNFLYNDLLLSSAGASMILGILLFILSFHDNRLKLSSRYLGAAAVLGGLYFFDYVFSSALGYPWGYIIWKKVFLVAGYLTTLFFTLALECYIKGNSRGVRFLVIPSFAAITVVLSVGDLPRLWTFLPYLNLVIFLNLMVAVIRILRTKKHDILLMESAFILIFSFLELILVLIFHFPWPMVIQYMVIITTGQFSTMILLNYNEVFKEHRKLRGESQRDPLTGVYNRRVLDLIKPERDDLIILIDLDNFKYYNDTYGHQQGDSLLVSFTRLIQTNLRKKDLVVRYGGDEFLVILKRAAPEEGHRIFSRIRKSFGPLANDDRIGFSYGINPLGGDWEKSLKGADMAMYKMKEERKKV